ncbi:MAG TPA: TlpA disulfide reductase family protein [Nitrospiraceae bacterium]|nr:TlpA disulfide reductase family protein [Nitrospiraceae bacterium]
MRSMTIGMLSVLLTMVSPWGPEEAKGQTPPASPAPAFEIVTAGGETVSNDTLKGRPALLVFWTPWCKVCQRELPDLAKFYQNGKPKELRMVSIGFADLRSNVEAFVKGRPEVFIFPNVYDEDRWLAQTFRINATPTYVAIDSEGHIALVHRGGGILQNPQFRAFLSTLKSNGR